MAEHVGIHEYRKYKTTFPVAPPPAPSSTRLSLAPPAAALTPRRAAGRVPCQQHAGRRTADAPVRPGAGCQAAARGPPLCDAPTLGARQREVRPAGRDGFQRAYSEQPARSETEATRWHTRRRGAETGTNEGTARTQRETAAHACGRAARGQAMGYGIRAAAAHPGGVSRTQDHQPAPPSSAVSGDRRRRTRRRLLAPTRLREQGRVGDPAGALRQRPTRRLPGGHALEPWQVDPRRAAEAGGSSGSPRPA